jgi:AsmA protein
MRKLLLAAAVIITAALIWLVTFGPISPGQLQADLQRSIEHATGRTLAIDGPVHIDVGLNPTLTAENVSLANIPGGSRPQMLTAQRVHATLALMPLLAGDLVIQDVTLDNPSIILERATDGTPNWLFRPLHHATSPDAPNHRQSSPEEAAIVEIHRLHLNGGTIRAAGRDFTIKQATISAQSPEDPMRGHAEFSAGPLDLTAKLSAGSFQRLQGGPVTAFSGTWPLTLDVSAAAATFRIDGGINHPSEFRGYTFLLTGNAPDLAPLAPLLPKPFALPLRDINFTARIGDGDNGAFRTSNLSFHAGAADLSSIVPGLILKEAVFSAPGPGQQVQASLDGLFQGTKLHLMATGNQPDVLAPDIPLPLAFSADAASAEFSGRGTIPSAWDGHGLDMTLSFHSPNLADLAPLLRRPVPEIHDVSLDAHVLDAGFRLKGVALKDLRFTSSLGDLTGDLTAAWSPLKSLNGNLTSHKLDLDAAGAAWDTITAGDIPNATPQGTPAGPQPTLSPPPSGLPHIDLTQLRTVDADLTLAAQHLTVNGQAFTDLDSHLQAHDGRLVLNPLRVSTPQGTLSGALSIDASAEPPVAALNLHAPALSASRVAALLGAPGGASGSVQVDAQLTASGDNEQAMAATLGGHIGLAMVDGTLNDAMFANAIGTALNAAGVPPISGTSTIRCFAGRAKFSHGDGRIDILSLDTSQMSLDGDGTINLADHTLSLHLRPIVRLGGTGVAAPVYVKGHFGDLRAGLDPMLGGRVGFTIGGAGPSGASCASQLAAARGGQAGPAPSMAAPPPPANALETKGNPFRRKPVDLLRRLLPH